jgi:Luciferase-like monooxygenase
MGQGFHDFIDFNVEAEALGYHSTFLVEHHFTGWNQVSATLTLVTWLAARTTTLRLGTAVMVLPWHNPVILAEQAATVDPCRKAGSISGSARVIGIMSSRASRSRLRRPCEPE